MMACTQNCNSHDQRACYCSRTSRERGACRQTSTHSKSQCIPRQKTAQLANRQWTLQERLPVLHTYMYLISDHCFLLIWQERVATHRFDAGTRDHNKQERIDAAKERASEQVQNAKERIHQRSTGSVHRIHSRLESSIARHHADALRREHTLLDHGTARHERVKGREAAMCARQVLRVQTEMESIQRGALPRPASPAKGGGSRSHIFNVGVPVGR